MHRHHTLLAALLLVGCHHEPAYQPAELPPPPGPPIVLESEGAPAEGAAEAQPTAAEPQPAPPAPPVPPTPIAPAPVTSPAAPPPPVYQSAAGHWVHAEDYGWVWVPDGTMAEEVDGVPYSYLYTPSYGWTWYVSPWGFGAYYGGPWVHHSWRPRGWRGGWVAPPHVVVRIGPHGGHHHGR